MGLSHSSVAGSLRLVTQENGSSSEAFSVASARVCSAHRGAVHVCLARRISTVHATARSPYSEIHQPSGDHKFLADVPFGRGGNPVSLHLRLRDSLFFGTERLLHLCLSVR